MLAFNEGLTYRVTENANPGISIGSVVATSSTGGAVTYTLQSLDPTLSDDVFLLDETTGLIQTGVNAAAELDFEQFESVDLTVLATSSSGATAEGVITIELLNVAEMRFTAARYIANLQENSLAVGDALIGWDINTDRAIESYEVTDLATNMPFEGITIDADNKQLLLADPAILDFELVQSYELRILANGEGGGVATASMLINIGDDPSDNSILETAEIYYNLDTDANNANGTAYNGQFFGVGTTLEGTFEQTDRNGETKAMGFPTSRVGLQPEGWNSNVHNGTFTISMWLKLTRAGSGSRMVYEFNCGVDEALGVFFETTTGRLFLRQQNGTGQIVGNDIISTLYTSVGDNDSDWVFLTVSVDNGQIITDIRALNTTRFSSRVTLSGSDVVYAGNSTTSGPLKISGQRCNNAAAAQVLVDDVVIFNRALSASEIDKLYMELNGQ